MKKLGLSKRVETMQASPLRKLTPLAETAKKDGVEVLHLNIGQPDIPTPEPFLYSLRKLSDPVVAYSKSQGQDEYIDALIRYYKKHNISLKNDEIIVTQGGSEAIIFAFFAITDPGDEILVFEPFYTNYNGFASMAGIKLVPILTKAENGFHLPTDEEIENKITDKTKAILFCNPNNPTGTVLSKDELERLLSIAKKKNIYLIADEVYREFVYDGKILHSLLSLEGSEEHGILVDSVSKRYSLCGARIGAFVTRNRDLYDLTVKFAQARLSAATIEQIASITTVDLPDSYMNEIISEYEKRRNIVFEAISKIPDVFCQKPSGAFYLTITLPVEDCEDLTKFFLNEYRLNGKTIMIAPAEGFYATPGLGKNQIRIAYILNENKLKEAMHIFKEGLKVYLAK